MSGWNFVALVALTLGLVVPFGLAALWWQERECRRMDSDPGRAWRDAMDAMGAAMQRTRDRMGDDG